MSHVWKFALFTWDSRAFPLLSQAWCGRQSPWVRQSGTEFVLWWSSITLHAGGWPYRHKRTLPFRLKYGIILFNANISSVTSALSNISVLLCCCQYVKVGAHWPGLCRKRHSLCRIQSEHGRLTELLNDNNDDYDNTETVGRSYSKRRRSKTDLLKHKRTRLTGLTSLRYGQVCTRRSQIDSSN